MHDYSTENELMTQIARYLRSESRLKMLVDWTYISKYGRLYIIAEKLYRDTIERAFRECGITDMSNVTWVYLEKDPSQLKWLFIENHPNKEG